MNWQRHFYTILRWSGWLAVLAVFVHGRAYSHNETSRLAAIEAQVQRGTWAITESAYITVDRIKVGADFYSDKPPMMAWLGTLIYAPLHSGLGWTLQTDPCDGRIAPAHCRALWMSPEEVDLAFVALTVLLVTVPGLSLLELMYRLARHRGWGVGGAWGFASLLGFATNIFPYSTVFANHVPAAAATFGAFYLLLTRPGQRGALWWAGGLALFSTTFDLSTLAFFLAFGAYLALTDWRGAVWYGLGGLLPLAVSVWLNVQITGSPLPPYLYPAGYTYSGSDLNATIAGTVSASDVGRYTFDLLVGERGQLAFFPLVLWYLWGMAQALARPARWQGWAWAVALSTLGYTAYFAYFTDNFGGGSYSPRWLLNPLPLLAVFALEPRPRFWRWPAKALVVGLAGYSLCSAYLGALLPWQPASPILSLRYTAPAPPAQLNVAMAGYFNFYEVPAPLRQGVGANQVAPRLFAPERGWVVPPGPTWWFTRNPLPEAALTYPLGFSTTAESAALVDLRPAAEAWLVQAQTTVRLGPTATGTAQLPLTFGDEWTFLGYTLARTPDQATLTTAWQLERPSTAQRSVFAHLTSVGGQMATQADAWTADNRTLQPGDWVFLVQNLPLQAVPPDTYRILMGLYNPFTGERALTPEGWDILGLGEVVREP